MQNGSLIRAERQRGPDVWEFRWREAGADGRRKHRRIVLGSVEQLADEAAARHAISALRLEFNRGGAWLKTRSTTVSDLVSHYRERELDPDTVWKTHSTKVTYEGYLNKWILPRWRSYTTVQSLLNSIASKQPLLADEIMPLDPLTEGDSRTKKHAECCTGGCLTEGNCRCWCHFVFTHLNGNEREDAEATRAEILKLRDESRQVLALQKREPLS